MKTESQRTPELTRLAELLGGMSIAMLTGPDDGVGLLSRPMAPLQMDGDGAIWFFTDAHAPKTARLDLLNLAFSDEGNATYVSLTGHGELVHDRDRIRQLWSVFAKPWFPDGPDSPNLALLKFVPHTAEFWDAPDSRMVRLLSIAASAIAGKPIGLGDHAKMSELSAGGGPSGHDGDTAARR